MTLWLWRAIPIGKTAEASPTSPGVRRPGLIPLFGATVLMCRASTAIWTFRADILREELQFSDHRIALAWLVLGAIGLVGVATSAGTDWFGIAAIHRLSLIMMGLGLVGLAAGSWAAILPFVAMGVFGAGYIISYGALLLWGITLFPERTDLGLGLPFLMIAVGQTIGAPLFAMLLEAAGTTAALTGAAFVMACSAMPAPRCAFEDANIKSEQDGAK